MSLSGFPIYLNSWLRLGIAWFLLGMAFSPSVKLYHQGMIGLLYLPAMLSIWIYRARLIGFFRQHVLVVSMLMLLFLWAVASLVWRDPSSEFQDGKRLLYILFFIIAMIAMGSVDQLTLRRTLILASFGIALSAIISVLVFYILEDNEWQTRLVGLGALDHPIRGGYVVGVCAAMLACTIPKETSLRVLWIVALIVCVLFMAFTQSRSVWVAFIGVVLLVPLWRSGRLSVTIAAALIVLVFLGYLLFEPILSARGMSFRTELLEAAIPLILERPFTGYGIQASPSLYIERVDFWFPHSHNMFAHVALELGLVGLMIWAVIWGMIGIDGWRNRSSPLGGMLLAVWVYATIVGQFSLGSLWDTPRAQWVITWFPIALWMACLSGMQGPGDSSRMITSRR